MPNTMNLRRRLHELSTRREDLLQEIAQIDIRMDELNQVSQWLVDVGPPDPDTDPLRTYEIPTEMFGVNLTDLDSRTQMMVMAGDATTIKSLGGTPPTRVPVSIADFTG